MASSGIGDHPTLNLTPEEKSLFTRLYKQADTKGDGIVTGEVAVSLFPKAKLSENTLGEIWAMADTENRGFLLQEDFAKAMRLIGHFQARQGVHLSQELAMRPCPSGFPKFEGVNMGPGAPLTTGAGVFDDGITSPAAAHAPQAFAAQQTGIQPQNSGSVRVPPLTPDRVADYTRLFESAGAKPGSTLDGEKARQFFQRSGLPNMVLAQVWNLADTEQRSALSLPEFIIAMHLLASYRNGQLTSLPTSLPAGLIEAASRRPAPPQAQPGGIPRQFSGQGMGGVGVGAAGRTSSPLARQAFGPPLTQQPPVTEWVIGAQEKSGFDTLFTRLDTLNAGFITGAQAVDFFSQSELPQESLAAIWDLATIRGQDQLNRDEFAVAMYLIRDQRGKAKADLPQRLPQNLIPPSLRGQVKPSIAPTAGFAPPPAQPQKPPSAAEDLFGLDALSASPTQPIQPSVQTQVTGGSSGGISGRPFDDPFSSSVKSASSPTAPNFGSSSPRAATSHFKPFIPSSSFGQGLATQNTGGSGTSSQAPQSAGGFGQPQQQARGMPQQQMPSAMDDLLGDADESSKKIGNDTSELANMSNQIGILRNQMADVTSKKSATEQDLAATNTQKRDMELRLSQFRTQYEAEARAVKELEEQLQTSRKETRRIQQDLAMLEAGYQDLQQQHRNAAQALESERRENAALKQRMNQINSEVAGLKPQLEQMQREAKIERGRVSINKKEVERSEATRDGVKSEIEELQRAQVEAARVPIPQSEVVSPAASTASGKGNPFFRKSPQPSFDERMSPQAFGAAVPAQQARAVPAPAQQQQSKAVESPSTNITNIFGPSFGGTPVTSPPPTSFGQRAPPQQQETSPNPNSQNPFPADPSVTSSEGPGVPTPSASPPPPQAPSRQITSSDLPLPGTGRPDTAASSVRVETPMSRMTGMETPTAPGSASPAAANDRPIASRQESTGAGLFDRAASPVASVASNASRSKARGGEDFFGSFGGPSQNQSSGMPGAFPEPTPLEATKTGESAFSAGTQGSKNTQSTPFGFPPARQDTSKSDFDSAFAQTGVKSVNRQVTGSSQGGESSASAFPRARGGDSEFPPIQDIEHPESDSEEEGPTGFGDSFTQPSPQQKTKEAPSGNSNAFGSSFAQQPPQSELPRPDAMKSPPSYNTAAGGSGRVGSQDFPSEFGGLLPSRENPLSSPQQEAQSPSVGTRGDALFGGSSTASKSASAAPTSTFSGFSGSPPPTTGTPASTTGTHSDAFHSAPTHPNTERDSSSTQMSKSHQGGFNDDFDADFDNLGEARDVDDGADDDFFGSSQGYGHHSGQRAVEEDEWNPQFDSPAASKTGTMRSERTPTGTGAQSVSASKSSGFDDFGDFGSGFGKPLGGGGVGSSGLGASGATESSKQAPLDDWEDMFSSISSNPATTSSNTANTSKPLKDTLSSSGGFDENEPFGTSSMSAAASARPAAPEVPEAPEVPMAPEAPMPPKLGRTITESSVHDVDDVKKLVKMGWPRPLVVQALEKYDYDFNKALEHLTGRV